MFTFRAHALRERLPRPEDRTISADVAAFIARMRTQAADGDVELSELLEELAVHIATDPRQPAI